MFDIEGPYKSSKFKSWLAVVDNWLTFLALIGTIFGIIVSAVVALLSFFG
jgi:hypothetical protein